MTIKQFIEAAIEGEWQPTDIWGLNIIPFDITGNFSHQVRDHGFIYRWILDPEAWKAVGRVKGWPQEGATDIPFGIWERERWAGRMHEMIKYLCAGKTLESYIESL